MIRDSVHLCRNIQLLSAGSILSILAISKLLKVYCQVAVLTTAGRSLYILRSPVFTLMNMCGILSLDYYSELRGGCSKPKKKFSTVNRENNS